MKKILFIAGAILAAQAVTVNAAVTKPIDLFDTLQATISDGTADAVAVISEMGGIPTTETIGGVRGLGASKTAGVVGVTKIGVIDDGTATGNGILSFSNDAGVGGVGSVWWDGVVDAGFDTAAPGLGETLAGYDSLVFDVLLADAGFTTEFTIYKTAADFAKYTLVSAGTLVPVTRTIALSDFLSCIGPVTCGGLGLADLTGISAIRMDINTTSMANVDLQLDSVQAVSAPTSMGLIGLGLLALGSVRKRLKRG